MIAIGSVRSSGATTLALALTGWFARGLLVEADPDGGVLALRYGLSREPGLLTLAASRGVSTDGVFEHAQHLPGGVAAIVAPESPERAAHLLTTTGNQLAHLLGSARDADVVVDLGRISPRSPALCLAEAASILLLVARPRAEECVAVAERAAAFSSGGASVGVVLCGSGPYTAADVAAHLGCQVVGTIPDDPRAARALADGGSARALSRSVLVRSARGLADRFSSHGAHGSGDPIPSDRPEVMT